MTNHFTFFDIIGCRGDDMLYNAYCRVFQNGFKQVLKVVTYRKPELLKGENALQLLPARIKRDGVKSVLIVTDKGIRSVGYVAQLEKALKEANIRYVIFDETVPNPTIENVEVARTFYMTHRCEGIIAFGGGSPIDCAKGVAARISCPNKTIAQMKGVMRVRKEMPPFYAIPTTAGTGSEATVAAVISNPTLNEKYALMDPVLIPHVAVLDPLLTVKLPPFITATTGMDALTHAVEAYIGKSNTAETIECSKKAVKLIHENLYEAYANGDNLEARANMQEASYLAGVAFTRAMVGNIHSIAHTLGGFYNTPHGLANAVIMPYVLRFYGETVHQSLAELADIIGIQGVTDAEKANAFIDWIDEMNAKMNIPNKIEGIINRDIPEMVKRALAESNPLYPVPKIMNANEMFYIYQMIQKQ